MMTSLYRDITESHKMVILAFSIVYLIYWNIDLILKIICYQFQYFKISKWHYLNFIWTICADLIFIFFLLSNSYYVFNFIMFLKSTKLLELVKFKKTKQVKNILWNYQSAQIKILAVMILIFSVIGMNLFGMKMYRDYYNEENNFTNFYQSFVLLLKLSTTESWNEYMYDLYSTEPYENTQCVEDQTWQHYNEYGPME